MLLNKTTFELNPTVGGEKTDIIFSIKSPSMRQLFEQSDLMSGIGDGGSIKDNLDSIFNVLRIVVVEVSNLSYLDENKKTVSISTIEEFLSEDFSNNVDATVYMDLINQLVSEVMQRCFLALNSAKSSQAQSFGTTLTKE